MKNFKNFIFISHLIMFLENCFSSDLNLKDNSEEEIVTNRPESLEYIRNPDTNGGNIDKSPEQASKAEVNKNEIIRNYFDDIQCPVMKFLVDKNIITEEKVYNIISGVEKYKDIKQLKILIRSFSYNDLLAVFGYKFIPELCKRKWSYKNRKKIYGFSKNIEESKIFVILNSNYNKHVYVTDQISYSSIRKAKEISGAKMQDDKIFKNLKRINIIISQAKIEKYDINVLLRMCKDLCNFLLYPMRGIIITITRDDEEGLKIRNMLNLSTSTFIHEPSDKVNDEKLSWNIFTCGLYSKTIKDQSQSYFYKSELLTSKFARTLIIRNTIIDTTLKMSINEDEISYILLIAKNKITNKNFVFEFSFTNSKLSKVKYDGDEKVLHNDIIKNLIEAIAKQNNDPFFDMNNISVVNFAVESFYFEDNKKYF
ncbi:hypothetical protein DMUE_5063 [Dictyocoela muelleri]|nr:hypothetical protein DMUE_5063 [Dictyocoela muelleri]